jgi:hypothetical protein
MPIEKVSEQKSAAERRRDATATGVEVSISRIDLAEAELRGLNSQPGTGFLAGLSYNIISPTRSDISNG